MVLKESYVNLFSETDETEDCSLVGVIIGGINSSSIKTQKNDWRGTSTPIYINLQYQSSTLEILAYHFLCLSALSKFKFYIKPSN